MRLRTQFCAAAPSWRVSPNTDIPAAPSRRRLVMLLFFGTPTQVWLLRKPAWRQWTITIRSRNFACTR